MGEPAPEFPRPFGNYTIHAEIGRGAMGVVYKAEQKALGRLVALKVLETSKQWAGDEVLARFEREGRVMAKLTHPDIVGVHDSGVEQDRLYIAMEFVSGMALDRYLRTRMPDRGESLRIVARVARALHHAHENGIVHRDIKPSNILVDTHGNPKLSDFGVAKVEGARMTGSGGMIGTPFYMSPEQARGQSAHADPRSDLYSLGVVLYEMLTGAPPHVGTSVESVVARVISEPPLPPRVLDRAIPRDVETICLKALAKEPEQRYASALAFAEDIDRHLKGEPILARRAGIAERAWAWARRNRMLVWVSVVLLLMTATMGGIAMNLTRRLKVSEERPLRRAAIEERYKKREYARVLELLEPEDHLLRAICLRETGDRAGAEREFAAHLEKFPDDAAAWRHRGLNALEEGNLPKAIEFYRETSRRVIAGRARDADAAGEYDALIGLIERHFLPLEPQHERPHLAFYDPDYEFAAFPRRYYTFGSQGEWMSQFPRLDMAAASVEAIDERIARQGEHPVLLGWRGARPDLDRAIAMCPISRWLRLKRLTPADRDALRALVPGYAEFRKLYE